MFPAPRKKMVFAYARTTALHYTPGARGCAENCSESWRLLPESWKTLGEFCCNLGHKMQLRLQVSMPRNLQKKHAKMVRKAPKSIKMAQNGAPAKKIAPRIGKEPKKRQTLTNFWTPLDTQNQSKSKEKGSRKSMLFSTPSWNRLCLILGSPRHPKSSQNEVKIDPRPAQTHFRPDCIVCRPCQ